MTHNELIDYIVSELRSGTSEAEIKNALVASGWHETDIAENLKAAHMKMGGPMLHVSGETRAKRDFLTKHTKAIVAMCIALLLLAGGAFAALKLMPPSPEEMLKQASLNMDDVHAFNFSGRITADVTANNDILNLQAKLPDFLNLNPDNRVAGASTSLQFALDFNGTIDGTFPDHPKGEVNLDMTAGVFTVGLKTKLIDETIYVRVDNFPKISEEVNQYVNTWIKIDLNALAEKYGMALNLNATNPSLTKNQQDQLRDLFTKTNFFSSITRLDDDVVDRVKMYHFSVVLDKAAFKNYIEQSAKINKLAGGLEPTDLTVIDEMQFKNMEVWIGKTDKMIHRIQAEVAQAASNDSIPSGSVYILLNFSNYNNVAKIEVPKDSKNIEEVIEEVTKSQQARGRDTTRFTNVQAIRSALERYYNDNNRYPKSLNNLKPKYLTTIPAAPTPPDGNCNVENNNYVYALVGNDYALTFCLGSQTSIYDAGVHTANMKAIE